MRTQKQLYPHSSKVYSYELDTCQICRTPLGRCNYLSGRKTVQTMTEVMEIAYQPQRCAVASCGGHQSILKSAAWQQIAPLHGTYGFDVIATIGWQRRRLHQTYAEIHTGLSGQFHTRSVKQAQKQLQKLKQRWFQLPPDKLSV